MGDRAERLLPFEITVCGLRDLDGCDDLGRIAERLDLEGVVKLMDHEPTVTQYIVIMTSSEYTILWYITYG